MGEVTPLAAEYAGDYQWQDDTAVPVPKTEIRTNTGIWTNATSLRISHFNHNNQDVSATLLAISSGQRIWLQDKAGMNIVWASWNVTGSPTNNTADAQRKYVSVPGSYVEGGFVVPQDNITCLITISSNVPPPPPPEPPYITGGPPFPTYPTDDGKYGISILDYFAIHVMAGMATRENLTIDQLKSRGPQDAYWIAALMVQVRDQLPITPTPVPGNEEPPIGETIAPPLPVGSTHGTVNTTSTPVMEPRSPTSASTG